MCSDHVFTIIVWDLIKIAKTFKSYNLLPRYILKEIK